MQQGLLPPPPLRYQREGHCAASALSVAHSRFLLFLTPLAASVVGTQGPGSLTLSSSSSRVAAVRPFRMVRL